MGLYGPHLIVFIGILVMFVAGLVAPGISAWLGLEDAPRRLKVESKEIALHAQIKALARIGIKKILESDVEGTYEVFLPVSEMQDLLVSLGAKSEGDFHDNGWQWDFWETWTYEGKKFTLSGCGNSGRACLYGEGKGP